MLLPNLNPRTNSRSQLPRMITRSKARAMQAEAQAQAQAQKKAPIVLITRDATNDPVLRSQTPNNTQARRPTYGQDTAAVDEQLQQAEMNAAFADILNQLLTAQPTTDQSTLGQQDAWQATFNPLMLLLTTIEVWMSFKRTVFSIALEFLQVTILACQTSATLKERVLALSSMAPQLLVHSLGIWTGYSAIICSVLLLHLFDALLVRRVLTLEPSAAARVEASSAVFLEFGRAAKKMCERLLMSSIWLGAVNV